MIPYLSFTGILWNEHFFPSPTKVKYQTQLFRVRPNFSKISSMVSANVYATPTVQTDRFRKSFIMYAHNALDNYYYILRLFILCTFKKMLSSFQLSHSIILLQLPISAENYDYLFLTQNNNNDNRKFDPEVESKYRQSSSQNRTYGVYVNLLLPQLPNSFFVCTFTCQATRAESPHSGNGRR